MSDADQPERVGWLRRWVPPGILTWSYMALAAVLVLCFVAYYLAAHHPQPIDWIQNLTMNLAAGLIQTFLTVFLIDNVVRRKEAAERRRIERVAFSCLRVPLARQFQLLHNLYKACINQAPSPLPDSLRAYFSEDYFRQVAHLDFTKFAPIYRAEVTKTRWIDYVSGQANEFKQDLHTTLELYAAFLDSQTVEVLQSLHSARFISVCLPMVASGLVGLATHPSEGRSNLFVAGPTQEMLHEYVTNVIRLVELYGRKMNGESPITLDEGLWRNDITPRLGSGRYDPVAPGFLGLDATLSMTPAR